METYRSKIKTGIPVNVCMDTKAEQKEWLANKLLEVIDLVIENQEPLGTIRGPEYEHCPACSYIIGNSAFYCKHCGAYVRKVVE